MRRICLLVTAIFLFHGFVQSQTFTVEGVTIYLSPNYSLGVKSGAAGDYPSATVHSFGDAVSVANGISYKGKNYGYSDFGGQLQHYFNQIKVTRVDITIRVDGTMCDHSTSIGGSWSEGETKGNALCGVKKGANINGSMTVNRITGTTGINDLKSKIDELESAKRQAEDAKKQQEAQQQNKDPWGSSTNTVKTNNGYNNNYNTQGSVKQNTQPRALTQQEQQKKLMDDFNAKMRQQQEANRIKQEQMTQLANQAVDATVQIVGAVSSLIRSAKEKKERERQRQLEAQRQEEMRLQKIAQEKAFRRESRTMALSNFKSGTIPTSTTKIAADKLYYFVYAYDPSKIEEGNMVFYLSPIVEIARFGDGTWPYLRTIQEEIQPLTPLQEVFHGYYYSEEEAEMSRNSLQDMLRMSQVSFNSINYQRKKQGNSNSKWGNDFWSGTPVERENDQFATDPQPKKPKDKFWDNSDVPKPVKRDTIVAPAPKKDDSFWAEPVMEKKQKVDEPPPAPVKKNDETFWSEAPATVSKTTINKQALKAGADSVWNLLLDKSFPQALTRIQAITPQEPDNLEYQLLQAHALLLNKQTDQAKQIYTANRKKMIASLGLPWEYKIREDFVTFLSKNINEPAMDEVLSLLNK